ncbi:hypothetical protein BKA63DRAFT_500821 [Paraphoma chrysanthemicola]|nr:hypothetical protein BKA63DRAFT_500821 [Paraphoma chrysanthemicola]
MATRRAHNKSRLGCHQCKKRRIKCDVKQPSCLNCDKKGLDCSFLLLAPTSRLSTFSRKAYPTTATSSQSRSPVSESSIADFATSPASSISPRSSSSDSSFSNVWPPLSLAGGEGADDEGTIIPGKTQVIPHRRIQHPNCFFTHLTIPKSLRFEDAWRDIRTTLPTPLQDILYHYEYTTSLTLALDDPAKAAWQAHVPEMASGHDFLVNCVLSVASLHLARLHEGKEEKSRMNALAAARMNKALSSYRTELSHITQNNAGALFASATLTAVYLFRTAATDIEELCASIPPNTNDPPPDIVNKVLACALRPIWALRGPLTVIMSGWDHVMSGKMHPVAQRQWWPEQGTPVTPSALEEDTRLQQLETMWASPDRVWEPHHAHLSQALQFLRETFGLVSQLTLPGTYFPVTSVPYSIDDTTIGTLTDRGAIFVWLARIPREFIQLIEAKNRDALIILAYYSVLPGRVRNVWWLEGLGADIVTAVAMALGTGQRHLIEWPASVVGVDLHNLSSVRQDRLEGQPEELGMEVI